MKTHKTKDFPDSKFCHFFINLDFYFECGDYRIMQVQRFFFFNRQATWKYVSLNLLSSSRIYWIESIKPNGGIASASSPQSSYILQLFLDDSAIWNCRTRCGLFLIMFDNIWHTLGRSGTSTILEVRERNDENIESTRETNSIE